MVDKLWGQGNNLGKGKYFMRNASRTTLEKESSMKKMLLLSLLFSLSVGCATQSTVDTKPAITSNADNLLKLPYITANRTTKRVEIEAYTTEIKAYDIVEFLLIAEPSGHGYEALAMTKAKPSNVHKALTFIGLQAGTAVDPSNLQFWPKGERVNVSIIYQTDKNKNKSLRSEKFVLNERTKKQMGEGGFVFTGSKMLPDPENSEKNLYAADAREPNAIFANYNEADSVFDVPWQAPKSDVYRSQVANPDNILPTNAPITIVIEPEYKDGKKRVKDLTLTMLPGSQTDPASQKILFKLVNNEGSAVLHDNVGLKNIVKAFTTFVENGHDPFVVASFDNRLTIEQINGFCQILASIETERGIRIGPPAAGQLYYRAFMPNENNRSRADRIAQPWELHLDIKDGKVSGTLIAIEQEWRKNTLRPKLSIKKYLIADSKTLKAKLDEDATLREKEKKQARLNVILVFAPRTLTYRQLMNFVKSVMPEKPIIHVYLEK